MGQLNTLIGAAPLRRGHRRSIDTAGRSFNPTASRPGSRVRTQARRCLIANSVATTALVREWCYAAREYQHWQLYEVRRVLRELGVKEIGRSGGRGRPIIWTTKGNESIGGN
jgi:hypothetical protein